MNPGDLGGAYSLQPRLAADEQLKPLIVEDSHNAKHWSLFRSERYDLSHGIAASVLRIATEFPDSIAVVDSDHSLTYRQLACAFLAIAERLQNEAIGPGEVVGVACGRGAATIIGLLATQYLAAVYLPLPDDWPLERALRVLTESGARAVLTSQGLPVFAGAASLKWISVSTAFACPGTAFVMPSQKELGSSSSPAYIIYTSGSTGVPKGAVVHRRGMMNHLACKLQDLELSSTDVVAQTAPVAFDISIWQMLAPLLIGAQVYVLDDAHVNAPSAVLDAIARANITVLELVPSVLGLLLKESQRITSPTGLSRLRWVLATGEALPPELARRWRRSHPEVQLMNAYGPTECSDDVTHHVVSTVDDQSTCVPIGTPVANTSLYVLCRCNSYWRACPPGEIGELFVGGTGVGLGYVGSLEKTRQVFFQDTLSGSGRIYRTGDLVRLRSDGTLEYRGRVDRQVKVRGIRIEPEELEAVLREHPAVDACAVTLKHTDSRRLVARDTRLQVEDSGGRPVLVAYVCLNALANALALRSFLRERLPATFMPDRFVVLASLPVTPNGKTDYSALPCPDMIRPQLRVEYEPPLTDLERRITCAWTDALHIDRVGRQDNFLELGGDSLVAMQIATRLSHETGEALGVRDLLISETPAKLADTIQKKSSASHLAGDQRDARELQITASGSGTRWPLSAYQEGVYFQWCIAPESPYYTFQGFVRLVGKVDLFRLSHAWDAVLSENPVLLSRFHEDGGKPFQEPGAWRRPIQEPNDIQAGTTQDRENTFRTLAYAEAQVPFNLLAEPVLRVKLVRFSDLEYRIVLTMHEILLDGWGAMLFLARLAELYGGEGDEPEHKGSDFNDYLRWERESLHDTRTSDAARRYWSCELSGAPTALDLPTDRTSPSVPSYRGALVQRELDESELRALDAACLRERATKFTILLAAFGAALAYYSNSSEVTIGVPIANRESPQQSRVISFLLNMLPLRLLPSKDVTCTYYLSAVREKVLRAFGFSEYPFSWMLRDLTTVPRAIHRTPVFQVMLNVLNYPMRPVASSEVTFHFLELDSGFTKYDFSLYAQPHGAQSLVLQLAYQTDLYDESTASKLLECIARSLRYLGESPDLELGHMDLLPTSDASMLDRFSTSA